MRGQRLTTVPFPGVPELDLDQHDEHRAGLRAQLRACPPARMMDYGLDPVEADFYVTAVDAGSSWTVAGLELADRRRAMAGEAEDLGRTASASAHYRAASALTGIAQLSEIPDTDLKRALYQRVIDDYEAARYLGDDAVDRIPVPGQHGITGWLRLPTNRPAPVVLVWGGLSGWGPAYHRSTEALVRRGFAVCLIELPGQGEPRLLRGRHMNSSLAVSVAALIRALTDRSDVTTVGVWAHSMGGIFALHVAAAGLIQACCLNSGAGDPDDQLAGFPRLQAQFGALFGTDDTEQIRSSLDDLRFLPGRDTVCCPLLILHGEADPLETAQDARELYERSGSPDATLVFWETAEHCLYSFAQQRDTLVADWFGERLPVPRSSVKADPRRRGHRTPPG